MRIVVGLLVAAAAAVGIGCSASSETSATSTPELTEEAPATPPSAAMKQPRSEPADQPKTANHLQQTAPDLDVLLKDAENTHVTSTVIDPTTGDLYATGTFLDDVVIAGTHLASKGDKDVFLLKVSAAGVLEWVRAVGSAFAESAPRVTLEGSSVNLVGMTSGAMDCGTGPLPTWSSATFFFCIFGGTDGKSLSAGVFPTGTP